MPRVEKDDKKYKNKTKLQRYNFPQAAGVFIFVFCGFFSFFPSFAFLKERMAEYKSEFGDAGTPAVCGA